MREILINIESFEKRVAIIYKNELEEFHVERARQERLAGNIYKGIIESVVQGIGALFVNIGTGKNGFLYISDLEGKPHKDLLDEEVVMETARASSGPKAPPKKGQEILVQVVKEPMGEKGPLLTTDISLPGKYLVLTPFERGIGVSKRVEDRQKRAKLKEILESLSPPNGAGCIARTQSVHANPRQLKLEFKYLLNLWTRIKFRAEKMRAPSVVYEEYDLPLRILRDYFDEEISKVLVDSRDEYKKIVRFASSMQSRLRKKIFFYRNRVPLFARYGIEDRVEKIFQRKINLKCGGSIVIEQTESLVAIDVNSGKFTGKKNPEETAFKTNIEAASEIAKQVMLRDVGGIIVIDFIDMEDRQHRKNVYDTLVKAFERDKARINILPVSRIGLIEMTRQRVRRSLESVSFKECHYCNGRGRIKTPATITIDAMRNMRRLIRDRKTAQFTVVAHPDVIDYIHGHFNDLIRYLERKFRKKIVLKSEPKLHVEEVHFE
ncbi:MAG: Rne/Rng family ribonuclease [Candidatus Omnitrophica bacterium]|nr:Rne/Rng family ribonuclease [Candidatus Omnitrophota bacterium]